MVSMNYAGSALSNLTVSTSIFRSLNPRMFTKTCYLSEIVGDSGFWLKNRVLLRSMYYRGTYYRGLIVILIVQYKFILLNFLFNALGNSWILSLNRIFVCESWFYGWFLSFLPKCTAAEILKFTFLECFETCLIFRTIV